MASTLSHGLGQNQKISPALILSTGWNWANRDIRAAGFQWAGSRGSRVSAVK